MQEEHHHLRHTLPSRRPEFHQLATFLKVVETRSFAAAARLMGRTQPAVSQAIARLEEIYGGDLFERRRGGPLLLTPIGEAILPSARTILHTVDHQMTRAAATAQSRFGRLTVGFSSGIAFGPLRAGLADFAAASCQPAWDLDPGSASNIDPAVWFLPMGVRNVGMGVRRRRA